MKAELISKENCEAKFTVAFSAEEFDMATAEAYKKLKGQFAIDGFRKGKAPRSIIEKRYGEGVFFEEAINNLLDAGYPGALDELKLEPVGRPDIDFGEEKLEKGKGLTITVTVPVAPEVTVVDYKGVKAERKLHTVTDADVQAELEAIQHRNARLVSVETAAENGDTVILDYKGFTGDVQFEGGTAENQTLKLGSGQFIPGFEDQLVGCKAGDEKEVRVTFPKEYHSEELAGKDAVFQCSIHEVKHEELPEINDDLALEVSDFDTLEEYKADIRTRLEKEAAEAAEYDGKNAVMEKIYAANQFAVPAAMIDNEAGNMMREFEQQLSYSGLTLDQYCDYLKKKPEEISAEFRPDAEKRVRSRIITQAIAEQEKLEATEEEIEKEFEAMAKQYNMEVAKLKEIFDAENTTYLKQDIRARKAIQFVYDAAELTDVAEKEAK